MLHGLEFNYCSLNESRPFKTDYITSQSTSHAIESLKIFLLYILRVNISKEDKLLGVQEMIFNLMVTNNFRREVVHTNLVKLIRSNSSGSTTWILAWWVILSLSLNIFESIIWEWQFRNISISKRKRRFIAFSIKIYIYIYSYQLSVYTFPSMHTFLPNYLKYH